MDKHYYIFITALAKSYESEITSKLLNNGYTLTSAASNGKINNDEYDSAPLFAIIAFREGSTSSTIYDDVTAILMEIKAYYYSIVITQHNIDTVWLSSNINFSDPIPTIIPSKPKMIN